MLRTRTTFIVILAGVMGLSMLSFAQQNTVYKPEADAWALQFSIGSNFQLGSFQGALLSIKKHTSPESAWRLGMGISGEYTTSDREIRFGAMDTVTQAYTTDTDNTGLDIQVQYVRYLSLDGDIKPYIVGGPRIYYSTMSQDLTPGKYRTDRITNDLTTFSAGLAMSLGGEWFVTQSLSLIAEYGLYLGYQFQSAESRTTSDNPDTNGGEEITTTSFIIDDLGARLGLTVYF